MCSMGRGVGRSMGCGVVCSMGYVVTRGPHKFRCLSFASCEHFAHSCRARERKRSNDAAAH